MSDFSATLKELLGRSAKFVGRSATTAAKATKYKVNEISTLNKRRELIYALGESVLTLCENGMELPGEANEIRLQINKLDSDLIVLRSEHAAEKAAAAEQHALEKAARAAERAAAKTTVAIEKSTAPVEMVTPIGEVTAAHADDANGSPDLKLDIEEAIESQDGKDVPTLNV